MKALTVIFLILVPLTIVKGQCRYENSTESLGIGIVEPNSNSQSTLTFQVFNDSILTNIFCSWNIYEDQQTPFCAKFQKTDYGILQVVVLETLSSSYKILINQNDIKYIPKNSNYKFTNWGDYLINSFGIRIKTGGQKTLKYKPLKSSSIISFPKEEFQLFCVISVKGDWVKVQYDCFNNQENNTHEGMPCAEYINYCNNSITGWLKWRDGNKLLIDIFTMP